MKWATPKGSLEYYYQARKIFEKLGNKSKTAMVINNIGIVLKAQQEYERVTGYYHEALRIYVELNNDFGIAACQANLGAVYLLTHQYDSALHYSLLSVKGFQKQNVKQFLPASLVNAGLAYQKVGNSNEAKKILTEAKKLNEEFGNKFNLAEVLIYLASVHREENKLLDARISARQGLQLAESIGAKKLVMEARLELATIEELGKNFQASLVERKLYDQQKDSLFQQSKSKQMAELEVQYQSEKKERQIMQLKNETLSKDLDLQRTRAIVWWIVVGVALTAALALWLFKRNQYKQQIERAREQEELAVA